MKSEKEIKVCSQPYLPTELVLEILLRLPVESLLRFRCVLKSWKALIDDPDFCRLHLKTFKNNCDETHLFVVQACRYPTLGQNYVVRTSHTFRTHRRLDYLGNLIGSFRNLATSTNRGWKALCSVDGLVMVEHFTTPPELVLWNPSNRRARTLTPSPAISKGMFNADLGFGYNPLLKDYQHVRFVCDGKSNLHLVAIYTVKPGSWKTIKFQGKGDCNWVWSFPNLERWKTVCLRGAIYFTMCNRYKLSNDPHDVVAFDLRDEVFASTSLPAVDDHLPKLWRNSGYFKGMDLVLLDDGNSLGVVFYVLTDGCIWAMETSADDIVSKCWAKRYTFTSGIQIHDSGSFKKSRLRYKHLKKNIEMILMYKKQLTSFNQVKSFNLETQEEKILLANGGFCRDIWSYKESMFML